MQTFGVGGALLQRGLHSLINRSRGLGLHTWKNVRVKIEGDPNLGMTEAFARDLRMDTGGEQLRGVRVAQVVQSHPLQAMSLKEIGKRVREAVRLQRGPIRLRDNVVIVGQPHAKL